MAANFFDIPFSAVSLTGTVAKTVVGVKAASNIALRIKGFDVSFNGATSTNVPALVELCHCTFGANPPGTNSTTVTPVKRDQDRSETVQATAGHTWTTEPTTITVAKVWYIPQYQGGISYPILLDEPLIASTAEGVCVRITSPDNVSCSGSMICEE